MATKATERDEGETTAPEQTSDGPLLDLSDAAVKRMIKLAKKRGSFFGFSRAAFGIVKTRTDGKRLLVFTDSANVKMKEAYAYQLDDTGVPVPSPVKRA